MHIKLKIGKLPYPRVGSIQAILYNGDEKVRDLEINDNLIGLLEVMNIPVNVHLFPTSKKCT